MGGVAHEQGALQHEGQALHQAAGAQLEVGGVGEVALELGGSGVQAGIGAKGGGDLRLQRGDGLRLLRQDAQHVQCVDVAGALPDGVEGSLAVEPRQDALLDIAGAAQAFERLGDQGGSALGDPILANGGADALQVGLALVAGLGAVAGAGQAQQQRGGGLGLQSSRV